MQLRTWSVVLLALLLAAMAMVPLVSADGSSIPEPGKLAELEKIPIPSLQFDYSKTPGVMNGEFLLTNDDRESSVITHQGDGKFLSLQVLLFTIRTMVSHAFSIRKENRFSK